MVKKVEVCDNCGIPMQTKQEDEKFFLAVCGSCGRNQFEVTEDAMREHGMTYEISANGPFDDGSWVRVPDQT